MIDTRRNLTAVTVLWTIIFLFWSWRAGGGIPAFLDSNETAWSLVHARNLVEHHPSSKRGLPDPGTRLQRACNPDGESKWAFHCGLCIWSDRRKNVSSRYGRAPDPRRDSRSPGSSRPGRADRVCLHRHPKRRKRSDWQLVSRIRSAIDSRWAPRDENRERLRHPGDCSAT